MKDIDIKIQGNKSKLLIINYKDQLKISLKELYKEGYIKSEDEIKQLSEKTLKIIIEKYRDSKVKILPQKINGGKHVIHQL